MGLFKNLPQAQFRQDYNYENVRPGFYLMRIDKVKLGKQYPNGTDTRTRLGEEYVAITKTVVHVLPSNEPTPAWEVGTEVQHYIEVTGNEHAAKNFAQFLTACLGVATAAELEKPEVKALIGGVDFEDWVSNDDPTKGPVQPLRGLVVEMNNRYQLGKKKKADDPDKYYTNLWYKREVPPAEVLKELGGSGSDLVKRFFPNEFLEKAIKG